MSDTFTLLKNYYDRRIQIDDAEGNVVELPICVRRFNIEQLQEFSARRMRIQDAPAGRVFYRKHGTDEQDKEPLTLAGFTVQVPKIPDSEIQRRRLTEMSDDEREQFKQRIAAYETEVIAFHEDTIRNHVWIKPGVRVKFEQEDGSTRELRTGSSGESGADLLEVFGGNPETLRAFADAVFEENTMSAEKKRESRSRSALTRSSPPPTQTVNGDAPAATATGVETKDSAASEPATASPAPIPSGSTRTSSGTPAPFSSSLPTSSNSSRHSS